MSYTNCLICGRLTDDGEVIFKGHYARLICSGCSEQYDKETKQKALSDEMKIRSGEGENESVKESKRKILHRKTSSLC